jgi:hypothetical protein
MQSTNIDVFFSCSFREEDRVVNDFFVAICSALDIKCVNVNAAYSSVPPDVARKIIDDSQALIAVATKRNKLESGDYAMPSAVQEEVSMAYGKEVPILLFVEEGVVVDGMKGNFCTHIKFNRDNLCDNEQIEKIIKSVHGVKLEVLSPNDLIYDHDTTEIIADHVKQLIELQKIESGYVWSYTTSKRLQFLRDFKRNIPVAYWASVPSIIPSDEKPIEVEISLDGHSRNLSLKIEKTKEAPDCAKSLIKIEPHPEKGDFIEYTSHAESKFFNPTFYEDIGENVTVVVDDQEFHCIDGFVPIQRTKHASLEIRFPRGFGLTKSNIRFFVGSYTDEVDYLVESEIKRAQVEFEEVGGHLTVKMEIESPLLRHMYGFAWNPPHKS